MNQEATDKLVAEQMEKWQHIRAGISMRDWTELVIREAISLTRKEVLEEAANHIETFNVIHGDHYAAYYGPSNDAPEIAAELRRLSGEKAL